MKLHDAVRHANIPTLLMVLVQLSGDSARLNGRYEQCRNAGVYDSDFGSQFPPNGPTTNPYSAW